MASERIAPVDAARGFAMVLVCVSHIQQHFEESSPALKWALTDTTRVALPTFLLLSGFVIGHLLRSDTRGHIAVALIDRGLFLLLVGHMLLDLASLPRMGLMPWLFERSTITDAIAIALFVAVLMRRAPPSVLLGLGVSLCLIYWIVVMTGSRDLILIDTALIPYMGTFLIGMALSVYFQKALLARDYPHISRQLTMAGTGAILFAAAAFVAWQISMNELAWVLRDPQMAEVLHQTVDVRSKHPPSPAYLAFYTGFGLILLGMFLNGRPAWLMQPAMCHASVIGRASLMCFIVQDWLLFLLPAIFGYDDVTSVAFWLTYLAGSVLTLYAVALKWNRVKGNRFFTVGLKSFWRNQP